MSPPSITVVIPNYNLGRFVAEAIESALTQTLRPIEVIVVDDGSTDDSVAIIERHPVTLIRQANSGVARARNAGAERARGEYLVFLDADDVLHPEYLERCVEALKNAPPRVAYAYTDMRLFGLESSIFRSRPFDPRALAEVNFVHASAMVRRSVLFEVGAWNPAWNIGYEDHELWVRMLYRGYTGTYVPGALLRYRRHGPSRNHIQRSVARNLHWKLIVNYPRLFVSSILKRPDRALRAVITEQVDRRAQADGPRESRARAV